MAGVWKRYVTRSLAAVVFVTTSALLLCSNGRLRLTYRLFSRPGSHRPDIHGRKYSNTRLLPTNQTAGVDGDEFVRRLIDKNQKTFSPWKYSVACSKYKTGMARYRSLPLMALASFPGSGNTWARYLIEGATGVFTGSVYNDRGLADNGFYGETVSESSGRTLLQKTHGYTLLTEPTPSWSSRRRMVERHGRRAVVLIRNPYEALISLRNFAAGHLGYAADKHFLGETWSSWVTLKANHWRDFYMDWLNMTSLAHVIHFENLRHDPVSEMRRLLRFVGMPENKGRLNCIEKYPEGRFRRTSSGRQIFHHRDVFSAEHRALLDSAIETVRTALESGDHPPLPLARYKYYRPVQSRDGPGTFSGVSNT
ncbi:WSC domain-containing protein 1-like [Amphibalanus amphitrite]|uniref:WSC domain-containing protein 1-like n=1 Tax=Amphibalanus amphitrite TaxID=1232801 RepID=UPI001C9089F8|nr:WSC domain-containing protein 1-like [Amphibalanus amphitrite]